MSLKRATIASATILGLTLVASVAPGSVAVFTDRAAGCLRRRRPAAVQLLHVGASTTHRLYAEQPKQGQLALSCGYGWRQEKEDRLTTRNEAQPA